MKPDKVLHIDLETYSSVNLGDCGVYKYSESRDFQILLFAFSYNDDPVQVIDLMQGEKIPESILKDIQDEQVLKVAHNASFERVCLSRYLNIEFLDPEQWECTMVHAMMLGLPNSLNGVGLALGLPEDKAKDKRGKALIRHFCMPCKPTKVNGGRTRNLPRHDPESWHVFKEYNRQDVVAEQEIYRRLERFPISESERQLYALDQRINDHGIPVDLDLIHKVTAYNPEYSAGLIDECLKLTGGIRPSQVQALKAWLAKRTGQVFDQLSKEKIGELLKTELPEDVKRVLEIRQEAGKSSVSKYSAFERSACSDSRIRGAFQFYGAAHTGRWAGRLIQPQNFPRNDFDDVDVARRLVSKGDFDGVSLLYPSLSSVFRTLVRTLVKAPEGKMLAVADYSAIEARVIAWLAGEQWRQDVFKNGGDIYCASASAMFHVPVEKHGQNSQLRKKGKIAELALGYAGGVGALKAFGADKMGLSDEEMQGIVKKWRAASPRIVSMWYEFERAAMECIKTRLPQQTGKYARFTYEGGVLFMQIPSGRKLAYPKAEIAINDFNREAVAFYDMNPVTRKWERIFTRGGTLVENICQAVARDCLAEAMKRVEREYPIIMHVHDEIIVEVPDDHPEHHLKRISDLMSNGLYPDVQIPWAKGLLLTAEGFTSPYYRKD